MKHQNFVWQQSVPAKRVMLSYLRHCKDIFLLRYGDEEKAIHALCHYEDVFREFFRATGVQHMGSLTPEVIEAYVTERRTRCAPERLDQELKRLQRFFDHCARRGYMSPIKVDPK